MLTFCKNFIYCMCHYIFYSISPITMIENIKKSPLINKFSKWIRNAATIASICLILGSCSSNEEKYQALREKVQQLEHTLKQQTKNYHEVSTQRQIQENLKKEWADPTINQEIWYSIERTRDQDKEIAETKEKLAKAQRELAKMEEEINYAKAEKQVEYTDVPKPDKYKYILEEFERTEKARENNN